jgi:nucleoside-diphosphate-sugar epimerase
MTLLVTGGAGFIGSNFVLGWLAQSDEPVVNLDALMPQLAAKDVAAPLLADAEVFEDRLADRVSVSGETSRGAIDRHRATRQPAALHARNRCAIEGREPSGANGASPTPCG